MRILVFFGFLIFLLPSIFIHPYIGVLLYSWISFMSPHRLLWGFPAIPLALITAVLTIVTWLFSREPKRLYLDPTACLIIVFMGWVSFTTVLALNPELAYDSWQRTVKSLLFVLITMALTTNRIRFHALLWVMAISIGYFGFKGAVFAILRGGEFRVYGPPDTFIADNNDIGAGLVVALALMNYVRMNSGDRRVRGGWLVVMAGSVLSIMGTYSRGATLGLGAIGLFLWLKSGKKLLSGIAIALVLIAAISFMPEKYLARISTIETYQEDRSAMGRIAIWGTAIKIVEARPLTGAGFKATESQQVVDRYDPGVERRAVHNVYLGVLAEHGVIGFLVWAALLFLGWRNSRWIRRQSAGLPEWQWASDFAQMSQVSLVGYCVVSTFGNYAYWDYYFTILGLLSATRHMMQQAASQQRVPLQHGWAPLPQQHVAMRHR